jgi:hypothetical protein
MHLICTPMLAKFYSCKKWVLQLYTPTDATYHFDDEQVDQIYQQEELPTSFVIELAVALGSLVGDGVNVTILQKWKQQLVN